MLDAYTLGMAMVFEDYDSPRFAFFEIVVTIVLGLVSGVAAGIMSRPNCLIWLSTAVVATVVAQVNLFATAIERSRLEIFRIFLPVASFSI